MKLYYVLLTCISFCTAFGQQADPIERAIKNHQPEDLFAMHSVHLGLFAGGKNAYLEQARHTAKAAHDNLACRFDKSDKIRISTGVGMIVVGGLLLNKFRSYAQGFVDREDIPYYREPATRWGMIGNCSFAGLGLLMTAFGGHQCYKGFTKYDRTQAYFNSLVVENRLNEWLKVCK